MPSSANPPFRTSSVEVQFARDGNVAQLFEDRDIEPYFFYQGTPRREEHSEGKGSSVERGPHDEKELQRKQRDSSVDSIPTHSQLRGSRKRRHRTQDDDLFDEEQLASRAGERERGIEKYERISYRKVVWGKNKDKKQKAHLDQRMIVDKNSDFGKSRRREDIAH
ncbi:hypothetical protein BWQ96_07624 [Gracilariopsis chorda]|uniref:Uncharacterized protein n=1 Tax=Gracilariopsis chorda TaxID=448386 RepID=A0A2V3INC1_9FLOR|nr:hypothetical protein BWQ96_07624 [Gracilariopsis chorda]|eukprot:PXF42620.1 hypothetical protein BWQ96_07624 [Gracilariopsis chorda]